VEDVRRALRYRDSDEVYLSPARSLPTDDLMSAQLLSWAREWWAQTAAELTGEPMAKTS
jgi:hypothetical protein